MAKGGWVLRAIRCHCSTSVKDLPPEMVFEASFVFFAISFSLTPSPLLPPIFPGSFLESLPKIIAQHDAGLSCSVLYYYLIFLGKSAPGTDKMGM